jgi:hypothetical protein
MNTEKIYQRIGEFVVSFQWLENRLREIGWLILDPHRSEWPPKSLRDESNYELVNKIESLYLNLMCSLDIEDCNERKDAFRSIMVGCHAMRKYRNTLLHSAYVELKALDDVVGLLRSDAKLMASPHAGKQQYNQEILSEKAILSEMKKLANLAVSLNIHYTQLIHWAPFDSLRKQV